MKCGECGNELSGKQRKWCGADCSKEAARRARLRAVFNITPEDYDVIVDFQGGCCAICGRSPKAGKRLALDHDHRTGFIRGALCFVCNRRLISSRSDEAILKMARYVTDPPARRALGRDVVAPGRPAKKRRPRKRRTARTHPAARVSL